MISKFNISPQSGPSSTKSLSFEILGIKNVNGVRMYFEDATHNKPLLVDGKSSIFLDPGQTDLKGNLSLGIPEHSAQSIVSLFATVEEKKGAEFVRSFMYSCIFSVEQDEAKKSDDLIRISPAFAGHSDKVSIKVKSEPQSKVVVSINDKNFGILTDKNGVGSISFVARDILTSTKTAVMQRFLVKVFTKASNYTEAVSSGQYLHILPARISFHADVPGYTEGDISELCENETSDNPPGMQDIPGMVQCEYDPDYFEVYANVDILSNKSIAASVDKIVE
jgi:hypothetical protein